MAGGRDSQGFRIDLGDELHTKLKDFCAAYYRANQSEVIREAVDWYIDLILSREPERRRRYEEARRERGAKVVPLRPIRPLEDC
jgi:Arc/MetJ-type ribon-helix-helix transcriptional regulator